MGTTKDVRTSLFLWVLGTVVALTVLSLLVGVLLAVMDPAPSDHVKRLIDACETTFKLGFGAILGLLTGWGTLPQRPRAATRPAARRVTPDE